MTTYWGNRNYNYGSWGNISTSHTLFHTFLRCNLKCCWLELGLFDRFHLKDIEMVITYGGKGLRRILTMIDFNDMIKHETMDFVLKVIGIHRAAELTPCSTQSKLKSLDDHTQEIIGKYNKEVRTRAFLNNMLHNPMKLIYEPDLFITNFMRQQPKSVFHNREMFWSQHVVPTNQRVSCYNDGLRVVQRYRTGQYYMGK
jgi:hypothetical protein